MRDSQRDGHWAVTPKSVLTAMHQTSSSAVPCTKLTSWSALDPCVPRWLLQGSSADQDVNFVQGTAVRVCCTCMYVYVCVCCACTLDCLEVATLRSSHLSSPLATAVLLSKMEEQAVLATHFLSTLLPWCRWVVWCGCAEPHV